jgi:hypothetical protein
MKPSVRRAFPLYTAQSFEAITPLTRHTAENHNEADGTKSCRKETGESHTSSLEIAIY